MSYCGEGLENNMSQNLETVGRGWDRMGYCCSEVQGHTERHIVASFKMKNY